MGNDFVAMKNITRLVIKVGTSSLTHETGKLNLVQMDRLVREIADLKHQGLQVILVTSGAVGAGMGKLGWKEKPKTMPRKQAAAAVGQGILMHMYEKLFAEYGETVAQVLLTKEDVADRQRYLNARNTLTTLINLGVIPIVNENDTVVVDEIKFGDNDTLGAMVAALVDAELLVLLSDIDGLFTADPRKDPSASIIKIVEEISPEIEALAGTPGSKLGSGGMYTKIKAAKIAINSGIPMVITNSMKKDALRDISRGICPGTLFLPKEHKFHTRKRWIAFGSHIQGTIIVDEGAEQAIAYKGKSLLPSGITKVSGDFTPGMVVEIVGPKLGRFSRGIVNYSSQDIDKIKGCKSSCIMDLLGSKDYDEVIHRDNLSVDF